MPLQEHGSAELASALDGIAAGLDQLDVAATDTVNIVVSRARPLAPRATGALSRSIVGRGTGSTATIGTIVAYGRPSISVCRPSIMRPRPFLTQAVDAEQFRILDAYAADVKP